MRSIDIINDAVAKVGLANVDEVPNELYTLAQSFLNRVYERVWNRYPFRDEKIVSLAVTASTETLIFPQEVDAIRSIRNDTDSQAVFPINEIVYSDLTPEVFGNTGTPSNYYNLPDSPVLVQPSAATTIRIVSGSADDTSAVRVFGMVGGYEQYENMTLTGTTAVTSINSFTELLSISKASTTGRITVDDGSSTLGIIQPWQYKGQYKRIKLIDIPDSSTTFYIQALRRFSRITNDSDTILITKAEPIIFDLLLAELYEYAGEHQLGVNKRAKVVGEFMEILERERDIDSNDNVSYPLYSMFDEFESPNTNTKTIF